MSVAAARLQTDLRCRQAKAELRGEILAQREPRWLSEVVSCVIHRTRGTVKEIAHALGVREAAVYEVADINNPHPLKAAWIPVICAVTGSIDILRAIAAACGCVVFALPVAENPEHADVVAHAAKVMQETAEALTAVSGSISDGTITGSEREQIERQIADAHAALAALSAVVERKAVA